MEQAITQDQTNISAITDNAQAEDSTQQQNKRTIQCPCCKQGTLNTPVKVPDELVDYWLAGVLSGTPFIRTYPMYGGKLNITVQQVGFEDGALVDDMVFVIDAVSRHDSALVPPIDLDHMRDLAFIYAPILSISSDMNIISSPTTYKPSSVVMEAAEELAKYRNACTGEDIPEDCVTALSKHYARFIDPKLMSSLPSYVCLAASEAHARLAKVLTDAGLDANFWKGIELA